MNWALANPFGIQEDSEGQVWHSGHVTDVLLLDNQDILAGADKGGVWRVHSDGDATPLSNEWDNPDVLCLALGPDHPRHIFAGCMGINNAGALWVTDPAAPDPLSAWSRVSLPDSTGSVLRVVVLFRSRRIVIATESRGVWWAELNNNPAAYTWVQAKGLPAAGECFGLAEGPNESIVAAIVAGGLFSGSWVNSKLRMQASRPAGRNKFNIPAMRRTSLASSRADRHVVYAAASGPNNQLYALLSSSDGGQSWAQLNWSEQDFPAGDARIINNPGAVGARAFAAAGLGDTGWRTNTIAASPGNPLVVALGWTSGPFLSNDGGHNWRQYNGPSGPNADLSIPDLHADINVVKFSPRGNRLFIGSDGGIVSAEVTPDAPEAPTLAGFNSIYNKHLTSLQFGGIWGRSRGVEYATCSANETIAAGGSQDNGNVYCEWGSRSPWRQAADSDGGLTLVMGNGDLLFYNTGEDEGFPARAEWDGSTMTRRRVVLDSQGVQPFRRSDLIVADTVDSPALRSGVDANQPILAVAGQDNKVFGLFRDNRGDPSEHWEQLASIDIISIDPINITAVASYDGNTILAGTSLGRIFRINPRGPDPIELRPTHAGSINRLLVDASHPPELRAFALGDDGRKVLQVDNGTVVGQTGAWRVLASPGLPHEVVFDIAADWTTTTPRLFAATDTKVYFTTDGTTWHDISQGLPRMPHCAGLAFCSNRLFLSTWGRSMWMGTHPCQDLNDAFELLAVQVDILRTAIESGEYPRPPRTPATLAAANALLHRLQGELAEKKRELEACRKSHPGP